MKQPRKAEDPERTMEEADEFGDEQWHERRHMLEAALRDTVSALAAHTGSPGMMLHIPAMGDGFFVALGSATMIREMSDCALSGGMPPAMVQ